MTFCVLVPHRIQLEPFLYVLPLPSDILSPPLCDYHLTLSTVNQCSSTVDQCEARSEITWSVLLKKSFIAFN